MKYPREDSETPKKDQDKYFKELRKKVGEISRK